MKNSACKTCCALILLLAAFKLAGQQNRVPPPKSDAEARKLMGITYDLHILPEGAKPEMLEHLLENGEVIVYYDHGISIPCISAAGVLISAPPEQVFAVLTDYTRYPSYVPMTEAVEVEKIRDNTVRVDFHLNVQMSFIHYRIDYGVYHYWRPPYRSDWCHSWGEFGTNCGFAELIPTADGKRTMFFYAVYSQPQSRFLKSIYAREPSVEMMTSLSTATVFVRSLRAESEKRFAASGGKIAALGKPRPVMEVLAEDPEGMRKILERGNLVVLEDGPTVYAVSGSLVNAPAADVYSVVSEFSSYPEYIPGVKKVTFLNKNPTGDSYQWDLEFNLAFFKYGYLQKCAYRYSSPEQITWQIPRECCGPIQGFWKLIPQGGKTLVFNGSTADVRSMGYIPRYALEKEPTLEHAAQASQGLVVINAVKQRTEDKFQRKAGQSK